MDGNTHIGCNVDDCKYHSQESMSCRLSHIEVVKNGDGSTVEQTDCGSFEKA